MILISSSGTGSPAITVPHQMEPMQQTLIFDFTDLPQNSIVRQVTAVDQLGILCGLNRRTSRRLAKTVFLIVSSVPLETFVENSVGFVVDSNSCQLRFTFSTSPIATKDTSTDAMFASLRRAGERLESFSIVGNPEQGYEIEFSHGLADDFEVPRPRELKQWSRIISGGDWEEAFTRINRIYLASRSKVQQLRDGISIRREALESDRGQADAILSLVASKTDNPVVIFDDDGKIEWVNVAFYQMTGIGIRSDLKPNVVEVLSSQNGVQSARSVFEEAIKREHSFSFEFCWNGETTQDRASVTWIEFQVTPIRDETDCIVRWIAIGANVTQRRQAELAMKVARDLAESASKAKSEFLAMMSHEIRTPMNAILGMTELTLGSELTVEQREYLTTANHSAQSLLAILNDILDLSKVEANRLELDQTDFNLADLVRETLDTMSFLAQKKSLTLDCRFPPTICQPLVGDPARLRQILVNLVGNSIKFTNAGEVVVEIESTDESDDRATLHFSVRDTGMGIAEDKISRIFEAFYQTDASVTRNQGGTGLGLSITSELVRLMGGRIWVESVLGKGSTFHFVVSFPKSTRVAVGVWREDPNRLANTTVAMISSEPGNEMRIGWIEQLGPRCVVFSNEIELRQWIATREPTDSLAVLIDNVLPGAAGFELANELMSRFQTPSIIMFSAGQRLESIKLCREYEIDNYLVKPVSPKSIFAALNSALCPVPSGTETNATRVQPLSQAPADPPVARNGTIIEVAENRLHVLVVDDHRSNRALIGEILRRRGHTWSEASCCREAMEHLSATDFDVVLMDVQMPDQDGLETTALIRDLPGEKSRTPVIATTAFATEGDRQRCLDARMDDYLAKPIDILHLIEKTEQWGKPDNPPKQNPDHMLPLNQTRAPQNAPSPSFDPLAEDDQFQSALARFAGDIGLLKMQMGFFINETPELLAAIEDAIGSADIKSLHTHAHRLKALIRTYDDEFAAELAFRLETMAFADNLDEAASVFMLLTSHANHLKHRISAYLAKSF